MSTVPSHSTLVDLHLGATPIEFAASETMSVLMRTRKVDENGQVCNTGGTYTVSRKTGKLWTEMAWAKDVNSVLPLRNGPTVDPNRTSISDFTYDGTNRITAFRADGILIQVSYPDSTTIVIEVGSSKTYTITLNALQLVTGVTAE